MVMAGESHHGASVILPDPRPSPPRERLAGLDLLRALAITLVVLWHFPLAVFPFHWRPATWAGVDLFFVLSGYLIGTQLLRPFAEQRRPSIRDFFLRRMFRVLPAYGVVLAIYFLVPGFREWPVLAPLWRFLTFTLNFGLDASKTGAFSHAWSLCVEEHFYLVLPVIVFALMRRPSARRTAIVAGGLLLGGMLLRASLYYFLLYKHPYRPDESPGARFLQIIYYPTYNRLDGLTVGVLIAAVRLFRPAWWARLAGFGNEILALAAVVLVGAFCLCQQMRSFSTAVFGYPLLALGFGLLLIASLSPHCFLSRQRFFGVTLIATLSYSLYLTHKEIMHLDDLYLHGWLVQVGLIRMGLYLGSFLVAAEMLYWSVERSGFRLRNWCFSRMKPVAP
jgi:peptidoglycan/LPS O-acetylase OafA/YrhL